MVAMPYPVWVQLGFWRRRRRAGWRKEGLTVGGLGCVVVLRRKQQGKPGEGSRRFLERSTPSPLVFVGHYSCGVSRGFH